MAYAPENFSNLHYQNNGYLEDNSDLENNGNLIKTKDSAADDHHYHRQVLRTAHNMSSSSLRKKSELSLLSNVSVGFVRRTLSNINEVILGTKLAVLFPAIPLAIIAHCYHFGRPWIFALSLLGLTPLAERVSFLTEQISFYTGPTVGGLLNATCGNATELIIAIFALSKRKIEVVKYSLLGSIISNLLLVLGTSLLCGGLANLKKNQKYDRKQADVNSQLLLLAFLCHLLPLMFRCGSTNSDASAFAILQLSRASSIIMLIGYIAYLFFQLKTHRKLFQADEEVAVDGSDDVVLEEEAVPLTVILAWILGIEMDLDFNLLETGCLGFSILITAFTLQDGTSHYMKGLVLMLCYIVIGACFFVLRAPFQSTYISNLGLMKSSGGEFLGA
ncbi:hypothetical protein MKW94_029222 [Papaver nudicaule]|uniref:Sodium/calcium exchanger membrane region domain-containing protein n=1 Tax=Papaver nudicaule TaxID=74823 RepID=A0AA41RX87_PAPNU|nr:hypothetical protein [Papaver nudicaule]